MGRTSTNSSRGFTLIELLVSLALGMLVVGTAVNCSARVWTRPSLCPSGPRCSKTCARPRTCS